MKKLITIAAAAVIVTAGAGIAAATTTTSTDVLTLATAESHIVTLLHQYQPTATWKAQFKAAEATQAADLAKVNADLSPPAPAPRTRPGAPVPLPLTAFGLLAGTAKPVVPAGPPGRVAVVVRGPVTLDGSGDSDVSLIVRNNTEQTVGDLDVAGPAFAGGKVVGSGSSVEQVPDILKPGQASMVDVYFQGDVLPTNASFQFSVTSDTDFGGPNGQVDFRVTRAQASGPASDVTVTGEAVNPSPYTVSGDLPVGIFCFSKAGSLQDDTLDFTSQHTVGPGAIGSFSTDTGGPCPTFLVGVDWSGD